MGPMATEQQLGVVETMVARAQAEGAQVLAGGHRPEGLPGWYHEPTLLSVPHADVDVVRNEVFGPVAAIMRFSSEDEALEMANATEYGLAGGIWTRDIGRAHRLVRDIRAGILWVNTYRAISPMAPIGGFGMSGYGRECGFEAIEEYTETKTVWINLSDAPVDDPFVMR
jgi:acyl-CoA reductase-like NAD-dependent aldehyde dehydrogenase